MGVQRGRSCPHASPLRSCASAPQPASLGGGGLGLGGVHQLTPPTHPQPPLFPPFQRGGESAGAFRQIHSPGGGPPGHPPTNNCLEGASGIQGSDMVGGEGGLSCVKRPPAVGAATSLLGDRFSTSRLHPHTPTHPHTHTHTCTMGPHPRVTPQVCGWGPCCPLLAMFGCSRRGGSVSYLLVSVAVARPVTLSPPVSAPRGPPSPAPPIGQAVV